METYLEMEKICKSYYGDGGVVIAANDNVNFSLKKGEIHALLGENGAGKSTLVRNLSRRPDSGKIQIEGKEVTINNPLDTQKYGIGIAYQDLSKSLVERHTIGENILSIAKGYLFSINKIEKKIQEAIEKYDLDHLDPNMKIWKLSGGEKQRVEILKAIITDPNILILDEPTSMLTPPETRKLFTLIGSLKSQGKSTVIITHHLDEAIEISDRITVMRQGKVVEVFDEEGVKKLKEDPDKGKQILATSMVGKEVLYDLKKDSSRLTDVNILMKCENLIVTNDMGDRVVRGISLVVKENQILGLAGIAGNGQRELIEAIYLLRKSESGKIAIRGKDITNKNIKEIRKSGISYIPEDRSKAMVLDLSVRENLILNSYYEGSGPLLQSKAIIEKTEKLIEDYAIKTPSPFTPMRSLSGGNRQKVVVARELSREYPGGNLLLIAENPTIGLDVGTTQFVRQELLKQRTSGVGILLVSSDLSEILSLSDEIAVIYKGRIIGTIDTVLANREMVGLMMGGVSLDELNFKGDIQPVEGSPT